MVKFLLIIRFKLEFHYYLVIFWWFLELANKFLQKNLPIVKLFIIFVTDIQNGDYWMSSSFLSLGSIKFRAYYFYSWLGIWYNHVSRLLLIHCWKWAEDYV